MACWAHVRVVFVSVDTLLEIGDPFVYALLCFEEALANVLPDDG